MPKFKKDEWNESKHPRDGDGKFTSGAGMQSNEPRMKRTGLFGEDGEDGVMRKETSLVPKEGLTKSSESGRVFKEAKPHEFVQSITSAKASNPPIMRWRVDIHSENDYANDKLFTTKGGSCVAIEPDGNIISVCKNMGDEVRGAELLKKAVAEGGNKLDAFGEKLYRFYTRNGFEPVSWTPFDEKYAPEGWDKLRDEPEPVTFFRYTGKTTKLRYDEFLQATPSDKDYGAAKNRRDKI